MPHPRPLTLDPAHHLERMPGGSWRMTGSDPQFLVRGPFARGIWEWRFRAGVRTDTPEPAVQIYFAPNGQFSEAASVRFSSLPGEPGEYRLRFWLPYEAQVLRFDPADAPGTLELGEVIAQRHDRSVALLLALGREIRHGGIGAVLALVRRVAVAARGGVPAVRRALLDFIVQQGTERADAWIAAQVRARSPRYVPAPEAGLLGLLTTVYNTPAEYLRELDDSLRAQTWQAYEWIVLDNGSTARDTRRALERIADNPRVKLSRVDANLGILGGMRSVLERASARYVLPVDSDDYLFPDALAIVAAVIQRNGSPALLYSDEDKLRDGRHVDPFLKPDWDPVLFRNCCYIAHLCAIRRDEALRLGVYSDPAAEGCHDWDTFLRLSRAGHVPVHVPEVLYSWRMHGGSTAANVDAKEFVVNSQRHVLQRHLDETGLRDRFTVTRSPLFPASPDWWIRRNRAAPPPLALAIHAPAPAQGAVSRLLDLRGGYPIARVFAWGARQDASIPIEWPDTSLVRTLQAAASAAPLVVVADAAVVPANDEWLWEMAGLKESFDDAVLIGGRLVDGGGVIVSPGGGRRADDPGYFGTALKQRSTDAVSLRLAAIDSRWLRSIDPAPLDHAGIDELGTALARAARETGARVVTSPFIEGTPNVALPFPPGR